MGREQLKRLKELEKENLRLRRVVSDLTLDKLILAEAAKGRYRTESTIQLRRVRRPEAGNLMCPHRPIDRAVPQWQHD